MRVAGQADLCHENRAARTSGGTLAGPRQATPEREVHIMSFDWHYTDSAHSGNSEHSGNWQAIGDLARRIAEQAGGAR